MVWLRGRATTDAAVSIPTAVGAATSNSECRVGGDHEAASKDDAPQVEEGLKNGAASGLAAACVKTTSAIRHYEYEDRAVV